MSKYINADELKEKLKKDNFDLSYHWSYVQMLINEMSSANVVEVVRCKECRYYEYVETINGIRLYNCSFCFGLQLAHNNDFCNYGERKETNV